MVLLSNLKENTMEPNPFIETADNYRLLKILGLAINANVGNKPNDVRHVDAQVFAIKCLSHVTSALHLLKGTISPEVGIDILDASTILVATRAALESLLAFSYVFIMPENADDFDLRYDSWVRADLMERQAYEADIESHKEVKAADKMKIEELQDKILKNSKFLSLSKRDRIRILGGEWRLKGWVPIAHDIRLEKNLIGSTYSYLCSYSHSGYLSILQLRTAMTERRKAPPLEAIPSLLAYITATMIKQHCKLFGTSRSAVVENKQTRDYLNKFLGDDPIIVSDQA